MFPVISKTILIKAIFTIAVMNATTRSRGNYRNSITTLKLISACKAHTSMLSASRVIGHRSKLSNRSMASVAIVIEPTMCTMENSVPTADVATMPTRLAK